MFCSSLKARDVTRDAFESDAVLGQNRFVQAVLKASLNSGSMRMRIPASFMASC